MTTPRAGGSSSAARSCSRHTNTTSAPLAIASSFVTNDGAGRPPFRATGTLAVLHRICREPHRPAWQLNAEIPDQLCDVIDRLLQKNASRRFASAEEVGQRMADLLSQAQQRGLGRRRLRLRRVWRTRSVTIVGAAAVALATLVVAAIQRTPDPQIHQTKQQPAPTSAAAAQPVARPDPAALAAELKQFNTSEQQMVAEMHAARSAAARAASAASFLQQVDDPWEHEVEAVNRELNLLESNSGSPSSVKGALQ
jgi:hypothetical protein